MISRKLKPVNVVKEKVLSTVSPVFSTFLLLTITKTDRGFKLKLFHKFGTLIDNIKNLKTNMKYGINSLELAIVNFDVSLIQFTTAL